jgi:hypothetical protein
MAIFTQHKEKMPTEPTSGSQAGSQLEMRLVVM